jgi:hypothetical protein
MSDVTVNEGGEILPKPDLPISEGQREQRAPRIPYAERMAAKIARDHGGDPISRDRGDDAAVRKITRKRPDEPGPTKVDMAGVARDDNSLSLRESAAEYGRQKREQDGRQINALRGGQKDLSPEEAVALSEGADNYGKPSEGAKVKVHLVDDDGKVIKPIGNRSATRALREDGSEVLSGTERGLHRGAELIQNHRRQVEAALANPQTAEQDANQWTPEVEAEINEAVQRHNQEQAQQQPVAQQPQPDALAQERQRLVQEYQRAAAYREHAQMTSQERQYEEAIQKIDRWAASHPEFHDNNLFQNLIARAQKGDVAAANKLKQFQHWANVKKSHVQNFVQLNTARVNRQIALEQHQAAQNAQAAEAQRVEHGNRFDAWLEKEHPGYTNKENKKQLAAAAKEILKERGYDDAAIEQLRYRLSAAEQSVLAEAAMWRIARAKAKEVQRAGLPPVQRPGGVTIGPRGGGDVDDIRKLQGKVSGARNEREALIHATALMQARRGR